MIELAAGPPATGKKFYDREELIESIWRKLAAGSILFAAPRLFGTTSVMLHLRNNPKSGFCPIFLNAETLDSPAQFVETLMAEMAKNLTTPRRTYRKIVRILGRVLHFLGNRTPKIKVKDIEVSLQPSEKRSEEDWLVRGKEDLLGLAKNIRGRVVIILDEFPLMIKRMLKRGEEESADIFLHWLHSLRQTPEAVDKLRFIFGGPVSVQRALTQAHAGDTMSDLQSVKFYPFQLDIATEFVRELFRGQGKYIGDEVVGQVLQEVETFVPLFLKLLVSETCDLARETNKDISSFMVSEAYNRLFNVESRKYSERLNSCLEGYYEPNEERAIRAILRRLGSDAGGVAKQDLYLVYSEAVGAMASEENFNNLMMDIVNDFYLWQSSNSYQFRTKIIRDLWTCTQTQ